MQTVFSQKSYRAVLHQVILLTFGIALQQNVAIFVALVTVVIIDLCPTLLKYISYITDVNILHY